MSRKFAGFLLPLVVAMVLPPSKGVAGPPEPPNGAMKLDTVADGLRQYRLNKADSKRVEWLKRLAPSKDPRVQAALESARSDSSKAVAEVAFELLAEHYDGYRLPPLPDIPPPTPRSSGPPET